MLSLACDRHQHNAGTAVTFTGFPSGSGFSPNSLWQCSSAYMVWLHSTWLTTAADRRHLQSAATMKLVVRRTRTASHRWQRFRSLCSGDLEQSVSWSTTVVMPSSDICAETEHIVRQFDDVTHLRTIYSLAVEMYSLLAYYYLLLLLLLLSSEFCKILKCQKMLLWMLLAYRTHSISLIICKASLAHAARMANKFVTSSALDTDHL